MGNTRVCEMNNPPRYILEFTITNYQSRKIIKDFVEGQYIDVMKTGIYKKYNRRLNRIQFEIERIE